MYKDEYKAVCNSAATKLNLLKTNPLGYFVASMLAGMFVSMGGFLAFTLCEVIYQLENAVHLGKTGTEAAFAAALSLLSWQERICLQEIIFYVSRSISKNCFMGRYL